MMYWSIFSYLLALFYFGLILIFFIGFLQVLYRTKKQKDITSNNKENRFSIVISARNEAQSITNCLQSIINQKYNSNCFEILVINDHSNDETLAKITAFKQQNLSHQITIIDLIDYDNLKNKKQAITKGIELAQNDYIILTDADCTRGDLWLTSINHFINISDCKMIYAPVQFEAKNIFEKIQALEFAGLVGIGASAMELKYPNMCSAANLIFEKKVFNEVNGYANNEHIISGDDEFLMHKIFKRYPNQVKFLCNKNAIVKTGANGTLNELSEQRKRWVSKSTKYENRYITFVLVMAYFYNLSMLINLFFNIELALHQMAIKVLIEGLFLFTVLNFFNSVKLILLLPIAEFFHILYVIIIGIWANFGSFKWKDRIHS